MSASAPGTSTSPSPLKFNDKIAGWITKRSDVATHVSLKDEELKQRYLGGGVIFYKAGSEVHELCKNLDKKKLHTFLYQWENEKSDENKKQIILMLENCITSPPTSTSPLTESNASGSKASTAGGGRSNPLLGSTSSTTASSSGTTSNSAGLPPGYSDSVSAATLRGSPPVPMTNSAASVWGAPPNLVNSRSIPLGGISSGSSAWSIPHPSPSIAHASTGNDHQQHSSSWNPSAQHQPQETNQHNWMGTAYLSPSTTSQHFPNAGSSSGTNVTSPWMQPMRPSWNASASSSSSSIIGEPGQNNTNSSSSGWRQTSNNSSLAMSQWTKSLSPYSDNRMDVATQRVLQNGRLSKICHVTELALHQLMMSAKVNTRLKEPRWTKKRMEQYLDLVYIRQLEQRKVLFFVDAENQQQQSAGSSAELHNPSSADNGASTNSQQQQQQDNNVALSAHPVLRKYGITREFVLFNTGLPSNDVISSSSPGASSSIFCLLMVCNNAQHSRGGTTHHHPNSTGGPSSPPLVPLTVPAGLSSSSSSWQQHHHLLDAGWSLDQHHSAAAAGYNNYYSSSSSSQQQQQPFILVQGGVLAQQPHSMNVLKTIYDALQAKQIKLVEGDEEYFASMQVMMTMSNNTAGYMQDSSSSSSLFPIPQQHSAMTAPIKREQFDHVTYDLDDLLEENLSVLVQAGIIDHEELVSTPSSSFGLVDIVVDNNPLLLSHQHPTSGVEGRFRRGLAGKTCVMSLLEEWIHESVQVAKENPTSVPVLQYSYTQDMDINAVSSVLEGKFSWTIPMFCHRDEVKLALQLESFTSENSVVQQQQHGQQHNSGRRILKVTGILPLEQAYVQARLLSIPQAFWLVSGLCCSSHLTLVQQLQQIGSLAGTVGTAVANAVHNNKKKASSASIDYGTGDEGSTVTLNSSRN